MINDTTTAPVTYRPGTAEDSWAVFLVFEASLADLLRRLGSAELTSLSDPAALAKMWEERRPLYEYLAGAAEQFWLAERAGQVIAYARSVCHDGTLELTELFVLPGGQAAGVGGELLARVFPREGAARRAIIASPDVSAQALYLKVGVYPHFPIAYFYRTPDMVETPTDLSFRPISATSAVLASLAELDQAVLGYRRDRDHTWLLADRQGYLYYRAGRPVGYGYTGQRNGPFALLDPADFPAVLAAAESEAARSGREFGLEVPLINRAAVDYLLGRRFRMDSMFAYFMSDQPFGHFDHYIVTSPPFFV